MIFDFYKNKFDRELKRRVELDNLISIPILGITIIVGLVSHILSVNYFTDWSFYDLLMVVLIFLTGIFTMISLFFIFRSSNNLLRGFKYLNFDLLSVYREIEIYNLKCTKTDKINLENQIKDKLVFYSDNHTIINDVRSKDLYYARTFVIISFIITVFNIIIVTSINF